MENYNKDTALKYIKSVLDSGSLSGNGIYTKKCHKWFEKNLNCNKAFLTNSCTSAIELAAILMDLQPDDEIIMPSFSFVSVANAFLVHKCKIVFVDIKASTLCIDENEFKKAITKKTKAVVLVHYAGVSCDIDKIVKIAKKNNIIVIEDAAQGFLAKYKDRYLGTIGDFGAISFHDTKNITCGEGGVLLVNNKNYIARADIVWEKGTNRQEFLRGEIDKYSWVDIGLSFPPSEITAAFLYSSLQIAKKLTKKRLTRWNALYKKYDKLGMGMMPFIPKYSIHNGHIFYIIAPRTERDTVISLLRELYVNATFHFVPLHSSKFGRTICDYDLPVTDLISESLVRIPL